MKALIVCKDLGPSKLLIPLAKFMMEQGEDVEVMTEGLASAEFEKAGFTPYFKGTVNFKEQPYEVSPAMACDLLCGMEPDVVVTASGSPIYLENVIAREAQNLIIPLVIVEDFWGNSIRVEAKPNLLLVLDEYAVELARGRHDEISTWIVGNHGVPKEIKPSQEAKNFVTELHKRFDYVFCFLGGGTDYTSAEIRMLVESLVMTSWEKIDPLAIGAPSWCLIPRLHPKLVNTEHPSGAKWGEVWKKELSVLGGHHVVWADHLSKTGDTEDIAMLVGISFGGFSTVLTTAAAAGKRAISLWPPETHASLKRQTGLDRVPLVALDCASQISEPQDLSLLLSASLPNTSRLKPFAPEVAYDAIKKLIGK